MDFAFPSSSSIPTKEIIFVQSGGCGNQIGTKFWETISDEHNINASGLYQGTSNLQLEKINVYFNQFENKKYVPRAVLMDLDQEGIDSIRNSPFGHFFKPENFISGYTGAGNNWARGRYTEGFTLIDAIMDTIRKETECCDQLQGFQLSHCLGGGTGSGFGALLMSQIKEEYPDRVLETFSVFPYPITSAVVEPYNTVLSIPGLIENADLVHIFDNESLYNICLRSLKLNAPNYEDLNLIVSTAMSGLTCPFRFSDLLNSDLRKSCINLVPFPRLHFMTNMLAPLISTNRKEYPALGVPELIKEMLNSKNTLCAYDTRKGKYMRGFALFRGNISSNEVDSELSYGNISSNFNEVSHNSIKASVCELPFNRIKTGAIFTSNSTGIEERFKIEDERFCAIFKRKAFIHYYFDEGMEEKEFTEAEMSLKNLISEYQKCEGDFSRDE